jgi:hypothetical protein
MKIEINDFLTIEQAAKAVGCNRRALYRAMKRAAEAGLPTTVTILGKTVVPRAAVAGIKSHYFPYYSENHQKMVKVWGAAGGTQKGINSRKRATKTRGQSS